MADLDPRTGVATPVSYVEWSTVFAGAVVALAISFVLLTFGAAVGLSAVSPWTSTSRTVTGVSIGAGFWLLLVNVWAFGCGGYLSGRMRHRWQGAPQAERDFRDDTHGLLVWATAVTFAAAVAALSAVSIGQSAVGGLANGAAASAQSIDQAAVDSMFRTTQTPPNGAPGDVQAEAMRLLARSAGNGEFAPADRTWLNQAVAARAGISQQDADRRVTDALNQAKAAADRARKTGIVLGFITAASLLVGAAAAWWGAGLGGKHREEGSMFHAFSRTTGGPRIGGGFRI